jgi:hypothetical protein
VVPDHGLDIALDIRARSVVLDGRGTNKAGPRGGAIGRHISAKGRHHPRRRDEGVRKGFTHNGSPQK